MKTLFQNVNFNELFNITMFDSLKESQAQAQQVRIKHCYISSHVMLMPLNTNDFVYFSAKPSDLLLNRLIKCDFMHQESGYFKFVQRSDLSTLVLFQYDAILGSKWIGIFQPEELPEEIRPIPHYNHASQGINPTQSTCANCFDTVTATSTQPYKCRNCESLVSNFKKKTTYIHHLQHGGDLENLINLITQYKAAPFWSNKNANGMREIHGNFEAFSLSFHIETDDTALLSRIAHALKHGRHSKKRLEKINELRSA